MRCRVAGPMALGVALAVALGLILGVPGSGPGSHVEERKVLENARVLVMEYAFPPAFKGAEHEAPADEFVYVIDGELTVVTKGKGKRVVRQGEIEWAGRGDLHYSLNETKKPARVLVVLLKDR